VSELPQRSLGKSVHLNRPGKKHNSGLGLPPIAVAKINKKKLTAKNITSGLPQNRTISGPCHL